MASVILDEVCSHDDFKKCETQYLLEMSRGAVHKTTQFQYAWCLVRTSTRSNLQTAVSLFEDLFRRSNDDHEKRDILYYKAIGHAKLKLLNDERNKVVDQIISKHHKLRSSNLLDIHIEDYDRALVYLDGILKVQPNNHQVWELKQEINNRMKKDGLVGMAIAGGAAAVGIAGIATLIGLAVSKR